MYTSAQINAGSTKESLMTLDEMPSWILSNIQFPQEAYKYGIAGIEQVCISASWGHNDPTLYLGSVGFIWLQ